MDYRELRWGELKSFAKSQGINTKGMKRPEIIESLDLFNDEIQDVTLVFSKEEDIRDRLDVDELPTVKFEGIKDLKLPKEKHPLFTEVKPYLESLRAYDKIKATSSIEGQSKGIAILFMKYLEKDKNAVLNLKCGQCISKYYERFIYNYNILAVEHGEPTI